VATRIMVNSLTHLPAAPLRGAPGLFVDSTIGCAVLGPIQILRKSLALAIWLVLAVKNPNLGLVAA